MKVYDFIIVFKSPNYKWVDRDSQLMIILAIAVFTFSLSIATFNLGSAFLIFLILAMIAQLIYINKKQKKGGFPLFRIGIFAGAIGWYMQPGGKWIALIYLVAALLEKQVKFPQEVAFDEVEIVFNSFPKKIYSWSDIANIVLKDGMITIDFRNNKLIQKEIESQTSALEEQEFNEFCGSMLKAQS